jgi:hypothetical protein
MAARIITLVAALIYLGMGVCAFVPALNGGPSPNTMTDMDVMFHFTNLFGQFPMNWLLAGLLILVGLSGLGAAATVHTARLWSRGVFFLALLLLFGGLQPDPLNYGFGLLPMYSWDTCFFLITVLFMFYTAFFDGPLPEGALKPVFRQW